MTDNLTLNVALLRRKVPNLTAAAKEAGLRPATVSNLCTGKIPVGRAEVRTLVSLAELAGCRLDDLIIRGGQTKMLETGIKVIDVFAPVVRGGTVGLVAKPGMGQLVVLAELFLRLKQTGFTPVFWRPARDVVGMEEVISEAAAVCDSCEECFQAILQAEEHGTAVLAADRSYVLFGELGKLRGMLAEARVTDLTVFLIDVSGVATEEIVPYGPLDTLWQFDFVLSSKRFYPAIDPVASTATLLEDAHFENRHFTVQQKAKKLLRRYRELAQWLEASEQAAVPPEETETFVRGRRLELYLTQPFYIAEPVTKLAGVWVNAADSLEHVSRIVEGKTDGLDPQLLFYIGGLPDTVPTGEMG
ncbi:F0F1-type ATP synthase, beta subunit [Brevibacillus sp. CF112]|uniref:ATP synthase subunit B n=1 Tax=Brevibacillus TaxID=55080 RepID=UPI000271A1BB|nr:MULTISPECIES: ATP synthase subunit B [Brevibacillus]EJL46166.1 F0F1-type ATP synthase, beta subunit [Brevibacillus sp. CF112]MED3499374.1 hypothetical protein [Brevibacillus agri]